MTENFRMGIIGTKTVEQCEEGTFLGNCPSVGRSAFLIESALIADFDTVGIEMAGMGSWYCLGTGQVQLSVPCDVVVVTDAVETPFPVACRKARFLAAL